MAVLVNTYSAAVGGTIAAGNQLWVATQSAFVRAAAIGPADVFVQAGVTEVFTGDPVFQNTPASMWTPALANHFVVGQ